MQTSIDTINKSKRGENSGWIQILAAASKYSKQSKYKKSSTRILQLQEN